MPFFDDLGAALSSTGRDVAQKAKNLAETTRLNGQVAQQETEIQNLYISVGKQYFEQNRAAENGPFAEELRQIQEHLDTIAELRRQILRIRGVAQCPHCGVELPSGSVFCPNCGKQVEAEQKTDTQPVCRACGAPLPADALYCRNCGAKQQPDAEN